MKREHYKVFPHLELSWMIQHLHGFCSDSYYFPRGYLIKTIPCCVFALFLCCYSCCLDAEGATTLLTAIR